MAAGCAQITWFGKILTEGDVPALSCRRSRSLDRHSSFFLSASRMDKSLDFDAPHSMGTTIIGVTYNGGVVLGADSRTSTGVYVANRASDKITQLTDNAYMCRSGSAADSQIVSDYVRYYLHQHTIQLGQPATVKVVANLVRLISYNNKDKLQAGLIVGGWDRYNGGKIYGIPLGGTIIEQPFAIGGSGSSYLYGFFDQAWREGMTKEEAEQLVVKAASLAIARDGASGGVVRTVIINEDGVTRNFYPGDKLPLWHEELEPQNSLLDIWGAAAAAASPEPMIT
ncbi:proteasome chaperone 1 [Dionaea muscipula]